MCHLFLSQKITLLAKNNGILFDFIKFDVNLRRISEMKKFFKEILI